ncbi:hypothetical protein [Paraliobacillus sp. JSM ZJ581]|uniref:hypothetical protein n=1 Tax=Paraliobacillus sp. JSM ZJ581 TaxID=3342118 RepID=UPI0035A83600
MNELPSIIEEKIQELDLQREAFISKIKRMMDNNRTSDQQAVEMEGKLLAYFSYSCNMVGLKDEDNLIVGSLTIHNHTSKPVNQVSIGLIIETENEYQFSGKYVTENNQMSQFTPVNWKRMLSDEDSHTYWFQWIGDEPMHPFSTISFSDFSISWKNNNPFYCSIKGFIYTDETRSGVQVNNKISIQVS